MKRALPLAAALDAHRRSLTACRRCDAHAEAHPIVSEAECPGAMLIGQAPGQVERHGGRPFAGRAGRTLFAWLRRAGIDEETFRRHVYIAAVTRCYPGPSPAGRGDRVPSPTERAACAEWLDAELRLIRPALLIPVGRLAAERFFGDVPLDTVVGRAHVVRHVGGSSTAVPLPHPSGASSWIHQPGHRDLLDGALDLLRTELSRADLAPRGRSVA